MAGAASVSKLNLVHELLAEYFIERLQSSKPDPNAPKEFDEEGNELAPFFIPLNAAELGVMVAFLKNNDVTATPDTEEMREIAMAFKDEIAEARRTQSAKDITRVSEHGTALLDIFS